MDFGKVAKVTKIGTQGGHHKYRRWVSKYTVSYSFNGGYFVNQLDKPSDVRRVSLELHLIVDSQEDVI